MGTDGRTLPGSTEDSTPSSPQVSPWALIALLYSMCVACPPASVLGPLLGLRALLQIKAQPERYRGAKFAWWAIGLGAALVCVWLMLAVWWSINIRQPLKHGPVEELRAGLAGDISRFKAGFHVSRVVDDAEAEAFLQSIRQRYGRALLAMEQSDDASLAQLPTLGRTVIPYNMRLDRGAAQLQAEFMISETGGPPMVLKWGWIRVMDPANGDLVYPAGAVSVTPAESSAPSDSQPASNS
jgi:hypothetical protein